MEGLIFDIKHFAIHDGPGIRQTVFFKACPLKCIWCHNPESWKPVIEHYDVFRRVGKKQFKVKETVGRWISAGELFDIIQKDVPFFDQSGGGVTFSGGEPLFQSKFVKEIAGKCKEAGIHTLVDTCGHVDYPSFQKVNEYIDMYYYDLKHVDSEKHKEFTGVEVSLILENLKRLLQDNKKVIVRIPVIPLFNDGEKDMEAIKQFLYGIAVEEIHLLPYHEIGRSKYRRFGISQKKNKTIPNQELDLNNIKTLLENERVKVTIEN